MTYHYAQWLPTWQGWKYWKYSHVQGMETGSSAWLLPCREHAVMFTVQLVLNDLVVRPELPAHHVWYCLFGNATSKRSQVLFPDTETKQLAIIRYIRGMLHIKLLQHTWEVSRYNKLYVASSSATRGITGFDLSHLKQPLLWDSKVPALLYDDLCVVCLNRKPSTGLSN